MVLTVRRQTEWKGIDVYYEVEVKVSKATDITFKEVHALLWAEASNVLACNAVLRRLDASTFTENDAAGKPHGEGQEVTLESLPSENTLMRLHTAKDRPFNGGKQSKHVRVFFSQEVYLPSFRS